MDLSASVLLGHPRLLGLSDTHGSPSRGQEEQSQKRATWEDWVPKWLRWVTQCTFQNSSEKDMSAFLTETAILMEREMLISLADRHAPEMHGKVILRPTSLAAPKPVSREGRVRCSHPPRRSQEQHWQWPERGSRSPCLWTDESGGCSICLCLRDPTSQLRS